MKELIYSILRYAPSIVSGEKINLAAIFYYPDANIREFYCISKWSRVSSFDDTLQISMVKAMLEDIRDEVERTLDYSDFKIEKFCNKYHSEFYFDKCITLPEVAVNQYDAQVEEIKKMYFQFEFDQADRPQYDEQKKFIGRLLRAQNIKYIPNARTEGRFEAQIVYDYLLNGYGIEFINLNVPKIDNKTMNKVKAWAWNCNNAEDGLKTIILYDLADITRPDAQPALEILNASAHSVINVHEGFSNIMELLDGNVS